MGKPKMSIVLLTFYVETVFGALFSLAQQTFQDFELILVVHRESLGGNLGMIEHFLHELRLSFRMVEVTWDPLHVTRNYNAGVAAAEGEILVFWDDATLFCCDYLQRFNEDFAMYEGRKIYLDGVYYIVSRNRNDSLKLYFRVQDHQKDGNGWIVSWAVGGGIRVEDYWRVGGFNERIVGWGTMDCDLTYRLARAGFLRVIDTRISAVHLPHPLMPKGCFLDSPSQEIFDGAEVYDYYSDDSRVEVIGLGGGR